MERVGKNDLILRVHLAYSIPKTTNTEGRQS
jgi:hypothetical protein